MTLTKSDWLAPAGLITLSAVPSIAGTVRLERMLVASGLLSSLTGLWMTQFYPWPIGDGRALYVERLVFGSAMLLCILVSSKAIRHRTFVTHGEWMTRANAIGLGAGTQIFTHLPWFLLVDRTPGETPRAIFMGAGWAINVLVAEWIIRSRRMRRIRPRRY